MTLSLGGRLPSAAPPRPTRTSGSLCPASARRRRPTSGLLVGTTILYAAATCVQVSAELQSATSAMRLGRLVHGAPQTDAGVALREHQGGDLELRIGEKDLTREVPGELAAVEHTSVTLVKMTCGALQFDGDLPDAVERVLAVEGRRSGRLGGGWCGGGRRGRRGSGRHGGGDAGGRWHRSGRLRAGALLLEQLLRHLLAGQEGAERQQDAEIFSRMALQGSRRRQTVKSRARLHRVRSSVRERAEARNKSPRLDALNPPSAELERSPRIRPQPRQSR